MKPSDRIEEIAYALKGGGAMDVETKVYAILRYLNEVAEGVQAVSKKLEECNKQREDYQD